MKIFRNTSTHYHCGQCSYHGNPGGHRGKHLVLHLPYQSGGHAAATGRGRGKEMETRACQWEGKPCHEGFGWFSRYV